MAPISGSCAPRTCGPRSSAARDVGCQLPSFGGTFGRPRMPSRAFLASNVFIFSFERNRSNSQRIVELLVTGDLRGVVAERVVRGGVGHFRTAHGTGLAAK